MNIIDLHMCSDHAFAVVISSSKQCETIDTVTHPLCVYYFLAYIHVSIIFMNNLPHRHGEGSVGGSNPNLLAWTLEPNEGMVSVITILHWCFHHTRPKMQSLFSQKTQHIQNVPSQLITHSSFMCNSEQLLFMTGLPTCWLSRNCCPYTCSTYMYASMAITHFIAEEVTFFLFPFLADVDMTYSSLDRMQ